MIQSQQGFHQQQSLPVLCLMFTLPQSLSPFIKLTLQRQNAQLWQPLSAVSLLNQYQAEDKSCFVPGFTAMRSSTVKLNFHATAKILTPILPYPATTYDSIFTTMINFQDALKQQGDPYGGLWADATT